MCDPNANLYKNKGDRSDYNNYREISPFCNSSESLRMRSHLLNVYVQCEAQYESRAGRSTTGMVFISLPCGSCRKNAGSRESCNIFVYFIDKNLIQTWYNVARNYINSAKRRKVLVNVTNNISGFPALYNCIYLGGNQDSVKFVMWCRKELGDIRYISVSNWIINLDMNSEKSCLFCIVLNALIVVRCL